MSVQAVIFDFGGVVTSSPFEAFAAFEAERGLPAGLIRRANALNPDANAWARFERNELDADAFDRLFLQETTALGHPVPGADVLPLLAGRVRPRMVAAIRACRARFRTGCITNNVAGGHPAVGGARQAAHDETAAILALFEHVIESSKAGIRKPDPRIYAMMCDALGVEPAACVYLDDLGINCKPAAAMGMRAIKVTGEAQALADLAAATGLTFDD